MNTIISTISIPSIPAFDILFGAGLSTLVTVIIFVIYIIYHLVVSLSEARQSSINKAKDNKPIDQDINFNTNSDQLTEQEIIYTSTPPKHKKKRNLRKPQPQLPIDIDNTPKEQKKIRQSLARELPQQGQGSRFEAAPGTFNNIQLTPIVEATIKPDLDSLTGIYDQSTQNTTDNYQTQNIIHIHNLLTTPEGIRTSVILSEILNHPNF
jgi:hypothetical protein